MMQNEENVEKKKMNAWTKILLGIALILVAAQVIPLTYDALQTNCSNQISFYLYCNSIPSYWMNAMNWISANLGSNSIPHSNTILAWWDYGDWINWFGHANAVLRGDNQVAPLDYQTAYMFVNANETQLASFMKSVNAKYLLFSSDDLQKWGAFNYLSCIQQNETTLAEPVGTSPCELANQPTYLLYPNTLNVITDYCNFGTTANTTFSYIRALSGSGNTQYCLQVYQGQLDGRIYNTTGTELSYLNLIPISQENISGNLYNIDVLLYQPINSTTCAYPSGLSIPKFYYSNYYKLFLEGCTDNLFTQVYPANGAVGSVRIWALNNFTATPYNMSN
jgi:hypothetical protein